jgi:hypothetical protein
MKLCFLPKSVSLTSIQPVIVPERFPWLSADLTKTSFLVELLLVRKVLK